MWLLTYKTIGFSLEVDYICMMIGKKFATCIAENVTISFKHAHIRHTLTSRCDVIGDVIIMKIILIDDLHIIVLYLLSNWGYIENCEILKTDENLRSRRTFSS